jgi:hypothetical protein
VSAVGVQVVFDDGEEFSGVAAEPAVPASAAAPTWSVAGQPSDDARFVLAADTTRDSNAFAISGTLRGTDGSVLARKRFSVSLDPSTTMLVASEKSPNAVAEILDLGATETDSAGKFTVQIPALRGIDSYVEKDGSVGLLFQGLDDGFELMWRTPIHLPTGKATQATAETPDDKVYKKSLEAAKESKPAQARTLAAADSGSPETVAVNQLETRAHPGPRSRPSSSPRPRPTCPARSRPRHAGRSWATPRGTATAGRRRARCTASGFRSSARRPARRPR